MSKKRFLIICGGNEGADTALMLRDELVTNFGSLEDAPSVSRYVALNTDSIPDTQYLEAVRFKDSEKIALEVASLQTIISESSNFGHFTSDLPQEAIVAENTRPGAGRMPAQGELCIRYHLSEFSKRLDLHIQQLFDPKVFPEESELCVVIITSGCTGTGRGIYLELAIETKRKLLQSGRSHSLTSYILSPEGLHPDDILEKERVFYAHIKELNALAAGEEYPRPFMLDKRNQKWLSLPSDYVFIVSARSETVSLASLREVKQTVVNHLLYQMTSTVGSRMESLRVDCKSRLGGKDGNGLPTFLSRLGIAAIDLPVRALDAVINEVGDALVRRYQPLFSDVTEKLSERTVNLMTDFGNAGVLEAVEYLSALIDALGVTNGEEEGIIQKCAKKIASFDKSNELEEKIKRFRSLLTDAQRGLVAKSLHTLGVNRPIGARDSLMEAVKDYYVGECGRQVLSKTVEFYKAVGEYALSLLDEVRTVCTRLQTAEQSFTTQIEALKTSNDFALAEYLVEKAEYLQLYKQHLSEGDIANAAKSVQQRLENDLFSLTKIGADELMQVISDVITSEKRVEFIDQLDFTKSFEERFQQQQNREDALRRVFMRSKPLTIVDPNYPKSATGVASEVRELVLIPQSADENIMELITKTHPIPKDRIITVPDKRLLVIREEHGFPPHAVSFLRDECASQYKSESDRAKYHITRWAEEYPEPIPMATLSNDQFDDDELLFLGIGLGVVSYSGNGSRQGKPFLHGSGSFKYLDGKIPIPLGDTLDDAVAKISTDGRKGESDREALERLITQKEGQLLKSGELEDTLAENAEGLPDEWVRNIRDAYQRRYPE